MTSFFSTTNFGSEETLEAIGGCMIALSTVFAFTRLATRSVKRRLSLAEDAPIVVAWACLLAQCADYIASSGAIYRALAVLRGDNPSSGISSLADEKSLRKSVFTNTLLMWISLWAVKLSLLIQCRQLVDTREKRTRAWWAILACCALSLVVCLVSHALVCSPVDSWFTPGQCRSAQAAQRASINLFLSYALDVVTDIMIMIFAIPLILRLTLDRMRKIAVLSLFGLTIFAVCVATVRVAQNGATSKGKYPGPVWLAVWGMIETTTVLIVGCLPAFALLLPADRLHSYPRPTPEPRKPSELSTASETNSIDAVHMVSLRAKMSSKRTTLDSQSHEFRITASDSPDRIAWGSPGVMVTRTFEVDEPETRSASVQDDSPIQKEARDVV